MKKYILLFAVTISSAVLSAQDAQQYLLFKDKDTIFCSDIRVNTVGGDISSIKYTDAGGAEQKIEGKVECGKLVSFTEGKDIYDMLPLDLEKPSKQRAFHRVTTGKIGMWFYTTKEINLRGKTQVSYLSLSPANQGESGANYLYATLDGGTMFRVGIGNYKKEIMPLFKACKQLMDEYGKNFNVFERLTSEMAKYYNENCL